MNNSSLKNKIFIFIFMLLIAGPMLSWGIISIVSNDQNKLIETLDFDLGENRYKATMSNTLTYENISSELEKYYNDRIPFRSILIDSKARLDAKIESPYKNSIEKFFISILSGREPIEAKMQAEIVDGKIVCYMDDAVDVYYNHGLRPKDVDPYNKYIDYPLKYLPNGKVIQGQSDWLFLNSINIDYYTGKTNVSSLNELKNQTSIYIKLANKCKKLKKNFAIMICPEKEEIYSEYMPKMEILNEKEKPFYIRDYIATASTAKYIYPKEELVGAKKKYLTYRKYDSHWNAVGGYLASLKLKEALGFGDKNIPLRDLKIDKVDQMDTELIHFGNSTVEAFPMSFEYSVHYKEDVKHSIFFTDNLKTMDSFSSRCEKADIKGSLCLIGDSFRSAPSQYFLKDFREFYCNSYVNLHKNFIKTEVKRADNIAVVLVTRNEKALLTEICNTLYMILEEYEKEVDEILKKVTEQNTP